MKIMLTGGKGMLGRTLVRELTGYEVICTDLPEVDITDPAMAAALCESALLALPEGKSDLALLLNHPALFPFRLPAMSGDAIVRHSGRIESSRYGLNEELLMLRGR